MDPPVFPDHTGGALPTSMVANRKGRQIISDCPSSLLMNETGKRTHCAPSFSFLGVAPHEHKLKSERFVPSNVNLDPGSIVEGRYVCH
jgi:hypothetical protein